VRRFLGLAGVIVIAGCVTAAGQSGAPVTVAAAPPIVALDEAPPPELLGLLDFGSASSSAPLTANSSASIMFTSTHGSDRVSGTDVWAWSKSGPAVLTAAQIAAFQAEIAAELAAVAPAAGTSPRLVASLPLADDGTAYFVTWHNSAGLLCTATETVYATGSGGGSPAGPCIGSAAVEPECGSICLKSSGGGDSATETRWVLGGTVDASADALDVTTADGATVEYPLTGPVLDGDRRVFLLDLGDQDWRTLVLLRNGQVVDRTAQPAIVIESENCETTIGPTAVPPQSMDAWNAAFRSCLSASGTTP
jgi:hypothetical protein